MKEKIYFIAEVGENKVKVAEFDLKTKQVNNNMEHNRNIFPKNLVLESGSFIIEKIDAKGNSKFSELSQNRALDILGKNYFDLNSQEGLDKQNAHDRFKTELEALDNIFFDVDFGLISVRSKNVRQYTEKDALLFKNEIEKYCVNNNKKPKDLTIKEKSDIFKNLDIGLGAELQRKFVRTNTAIIEIIKHGEKTNKKKTFQYVSYEQMKAIYVDVQ